MNATNATNASPIQNDETALRELALRLLAPRYPGMTPSDEIQLLPGQLPPRLPFEPLLPDGSRIVGSQAGGGHATIVLDVPVPAAEAVAFYRERMKATGWEEQDVEQFHQGGFVHGRMGNLETLTLFLGAQGPMLNVVAYGTAGTAADVRLMLTSAAERRQFGPMHPRRRQQDMSEMIPPLTAPAGSQQWREGGGGGGNSWHANARLETDLEPDAIAAHMVATAFARERAARRMTRGPSAR